MLFVLIGMCLVVDLYFCFVYFMGGIFVDDLFMSLAFVALCYFVLFSIFEMCLFIVVWCVCMFDIINWIEF